MGNCCSGSNIEPSVPTPQKTQPPQPTSIPDGTTSTPSPGPASEQGRHDGGSPPPSPRGDSQHPDRQEMRSYQYPSGGTDPMQRTRSGPMSEASPSALSHSYRRKNMSASPVEHGIGHQRSGTHTVSPLPPPTRKNTAGRRGGQTRFPFTLQGLLLNDFRFRILVVGKHDCGKSSLIKSIFKVDMSGSPINISGRTTEFRPRDNRHLMVHECSSSGPGEMQAIRDFITTRNHNSRPASERLHAIWICIPMSDVINGQVDEGVKMLLDIGVPFVMVFTKFDLIGSSSLNDYEGRCRSLFGNVPADIVSTQPKFHHLINRLVATTDGVIIAHSRNVSAPPEAQRAQPRLSPVSLAWSVSQRASRDINVQAAIEVGRHRYWRRLWSSDDFLTQPLASCVEVFHSDIVDTWNLPDKDKYFSSTEFRAEISYIVQDLTVSPISTSSRHRLDGTPGTGAAWLNGRYENSHETICLVMGYIVDLTLILCNVFGSHGNVSRSEAESVINDFGSSSLKTSIHSDISSFIRTVPQFQYGDNDVVMAKTIDLISRNCGPSSGNDTYR